MNTHSAYFRKGGLVLAAVALGGFLADYLFNMGLTRILSVHQYGDYKVAYAFASLAGIAVLMGGDRAAPRVLSGLIQQQRPSGVWRYIRYYLGIAFLLSVLVIGATVAVGFFHVGTWDLSEHHAIGIAVFAVPLIAAGAMLSRTLQSAKRLGLANLPWRVVFPMVKLGLVAGFFWVLGGLALQTVILLAIGAILIVCLGQFAAVRKLKLVVFQSDQSVQSQGWLKMSVPMMMALLVAMALRQTDLYMLEILGEEHHVGYFGAAATLAHFLMLIQLTVTGLAAPLIGPAMDSGEAESHAVYRSAQRLMLMLVIPASLILALFGEMILGWFGSGYDSAYRAFVLLAAGYAMWAWGGLSGTWLQYEGKGNMVVWVNTGALVLAVVFNMLLIPRLGMVGAGIATAVAFSAGAVTLVLLRRTIRPIVAGAGADGS